MDIIFFMLLILTTIGFAIFFKSTKREKQKKEDQINELEKKIKDQSTFTEDLLNKLETKTKNTEELKQEILKIKEEKRDLENKSKRLQYEINQLEPFKHIKNAYEEALIIKDESLEAQKKAEEEAENTIKNAIRKAEEIESEAINNAQKAQEKANELKASILAMRNVIDGYGDKYIKPSFSLLDELADQYEFEQAGKKLKQAREETRGMIDNGTAAKCSYVERYRKETAIRFVLDAFNGKVDSILSRAKTENYGTLEQQIKDAFALVNNNGSAFRDAKITEEYLNSRLSELKWAVSVNILKEKEREEQRQIREQIREEEKARREIERALKEAEKEEETIQKAMEKARSQIEKATESKRAELEARLEELQQKLAEAESRNQRALSMAQQTKAGHVYVISNIGSFGEDVYKVGMTRRLDPLDRVKELGDASVPFSFDVHAMIYSDDAPKLEKTLHKHFLKAQVNKVNPRKEFFRLPLKDIRTIVEENKIEASWTMTATAKEYRESLAIEKSMAENGVSVAEWLKNQEMLAETNTELFEAEEE